MAKRVNAELPEHLKILFYGMPGSTKTRTIATAAADPRTSPCLILNSRGNPLAFRDYPQKPDIIDMEQMEDYNPVYAWLKAGQPANHPYAQEFALRPPYRSLVIDSITETQRFSFNIVAGNKDIGPGTLPKAVEIQHFNRVLANMIKFTGLFFDLPMHIFLTSLEDERKDDQTGAMHYRPLIWGQSGTEIGGYSYMLMRLVHVAALEPRIVRILEENEGKEVVADMISIGLLRRTGQYVAKDQYGTGLPYMIDPSIPKILDAVYGVGGK